MVKVMRLWRVAEDARMRRESQTAGIVAMIAALLVPS